MARLVQLIHQDKEDQISKCDMKEFSVYLSQFLPGKTDSFSQRFLHLSAIVYCAIQKAKDFIPRSGHLDKWIDDIENIFNRTKSKVGGAICKKLPKVPLTLGIIGQMLSFIIKGERLAVILETFLPQLTKMYHDKVGPELMKQMKHDDVMAGIDVMNLMTCIEGIKCTGSSFDGLKLPPILTNDGRYGYFADLDFMLVLNNASVSNYRRKLKEPTFGIIDSRSTHPGYTKVAIPRPLCTDNEFINTMTQVSHLNDPESSKLFLVNFINMMADIFDKTKLQGSDNITITTNGPAITMECNDILAGSSLSFNLSVDIVYSINVPKWPDEAREWIKRVRPGDWPKAKLINQIKQDGCHLVPMAHSLSNGAITEWRFSFSIAERTLCYSLNKQQLRCYHLLKVIYHDLLKEKTQMKSYYLKTILFWACEKIPQDHWVTETLAFCFFSLLDDLIDALRKQFLRNYFIPENNIIDHIEGEDLKKSVRILKRVRKHPAEYLAKCQERYRFQDAPTDFSPLTHILLPVMQQVIANKVLDQDVASMNMDCVYEMANDLALSNVRIRNYDAAVQNLIDIYPMDNKEYHQNEQQVKPIGYHLAKLGRDITGMKERAKFFKRARDKFKETSPEYSYMLAQHVMSLICLDSCDPSIEGNLEFSISLRHVSPIAYCEYANYLLSKADATQDDVMRAIAFLRKVIPLEAKKHPSKQDCLVYSKHEKELLDDGINLLFCVARHDIVELPCLVYVDYMLISIYVDIGMKDDAQRIIPFMKKECQNTSNDMTNALLFLSHKKLHNHADAFVEISKTATQRLTGILKERTAPLVGRFTKIGQGVKMGMAALKGTLQ